MIAAQASLLLPLLFLLAPDSAAQHSTPAAIPADSFKTYHVRRASAPLKIDADWNKPAWQQAETGTIALHMGPRPEHFPEARFRMLYDDEAIYLIFQVHDRYVRAVATHDEGNAWEDSCVEFFFSPAAETTAGYFNFETNCAGARYWHHHPAPKGEKALAPADLAQVQLAHSLSGPIDPERTEPVTWTVEYRIPLAILRHYTQVTTPAPGAKWRANFYKCADKSSHPHFLTWSRIDKPKPQFHLPAFFGTLEFTD